MRNFFLCILLICLLKQSNAVKLTSNQSDQNLGFFGQLEKSFESLISYQDPNRNLFSNQSKNENFPKQQTDDLQNNEQKENSEVTMNHQTQQQINNQDEYKQISSKQQSKLNSKLYSNRNQILQKQCLGGYELQGVNLNEINKDYLRQFVKNTCLPIILVPGYLGTRLRVIIQDTSKVDDKTRIDCEDYINSGKDIDLIAEKDLEWDIWPETIKNNQETLSKCFNSLMAFGWNDSVNSLEDLYKNTKEGIQIEIYGNTKSSRNKQNGCKKDSSAIINLSLHVKDSGNQKIQQGYKKMIESLLQMGYKEGITLFSLPFDWRRSSNDDEFSNKLKIILEDNYNLLKKKSVIISHSTGGLNTLYSLNQFDQDFKEVTIERYVSIAVPYTGSVYPFKNIILAQNPFKEFDQVHDEDQEFLRSILTSTPVFYDMMLNFNIYDHQISSEWVMSLKEHINKVETLEKDNEYWNQDSRQFAWFPKPFEVCNQIRNSKDKSCGFYFYDYFQNSFLKTNIDGVKFNYQVLEQDIVNSLGKFGILTNQEIKVFQQEQDEYQKLGQSLQHDQEQQDHQVHQTDSLDQKIIEQDGEEQKQPEIQQPKPVTPQVDSIDIQEKLDEMKGVYFNQTSTIIDVDDFAVENNSFLQKNMRSKISKSSTDIKSQTQKKSLSNKTKSRKTGQSQIASSKTSFNTDQTNQDQAIEMAKQRIIKMLDMVQTSKKSLDNPGIPMTIIYGAQRKTPVAFHLLDNTRNDEGKNYIQEENFLIEQGYGDGIISTDGTLLAGLKWAYEFDNYDQTQSQPVHIIEFCSTYNPIEIGSMYVPPKENSYNGIQCEKDKDHFNMISDFNIIDMVRQIGQSGQSMGDSHINSLTDIEISQIFNECARITEILETLQDDDTREVPLESDLLNAKSHQQKAFYNGRAKIIVEATYKSDDSLPSQN